MTVLLSLATSKEMAIMTILDCLTLYAAIAVTLMLVAGGWVQMRNFYRKRDEEEKAKLEAIIEARAQELLNKQAGTPAGGLTV
jgi:hypothetical protein